MIPLAISLTDIKAEGDKDTMNYYIIHIFFMYACSMYALSYRPQFVQLKSFRSRTTAVTKGIPQGSILGPLLLIIYPFPLCGIFRKYSIRFHCYAGDTRHYHSTKPNNATPPSSLQECLSEIKVWFDSNLFQLNKV